MEKKITEQFRNIFPGAATPLIVRSPGRVNIIGEHTDYNEGFVLPAAIDFRAWGAGTRRRDSTLIIYSANTGAHAELDVNKLQPLRNWSHYPAAVVSEMNKYGCSLFGM